MSPAARQPSRQPPLDDFNANELVQEHTRSIGSLQEQVDRLTERYGDDDKFGKTFEALAQKDKRVDGAISDILVHLIETNAQVRGAVNAAVGASDRAALAVYGRRVGFAAWSVALAIISASAGALVGHIWR